MNARFSSFTALFAFLAVAYSVGCSAEDGAAPHITTAPGQGAYKEAGMCKADSDCQPNESCTNGLCVIKRCASNSFKSTQAPLPANGYLVVDRELMVASSSDVNAFNLSGKSLAGMAAGKISAGKRVVDVAGGNLLGSHPDAVAVATEGSTTVTIKQGDKTSSVDVGFVPVAIGAGMTHQDGHDHLVAVKADGTMAICDATTSQCEKPISVGVSGITDLAVADVDGDGFAEPILLTANKIIAYNFDGGHASSGQLTQVSSSPVAMSRIAAGDVDGDAKDDVVGIDASVKNKIYVLSYGTGGAAGFSVRTTTTAALNAVDLAVGGMGGDKPQVTVIGDGQAQVFEGKEDGGLTASFTSSVGAATRAFAADIDGDSVPARLKEKPKVVSGALVPLAVLVPPPYSKTYSGEFNGGTKSSVTLSTTASKTDGTSTSKTDSDSISLTTGWAVDLGVGPNLGPVGIKVNASYNKSVTDRVGKSVTRSTDYQTTVSIGQTFTFDVKPEVDGYDSGAIVVGCGCYNQYSYDVDDPQHRLGEGADGAVFKVNIPIGGQTSLWSIRRYNQLAEASDGSIPVITGGPKIGDIESYPEAPVGIDGKPIPGADLVFPDPPSYRVSEAGTTAFSLDMSKSKTDSTQNSTETGHGWSYGGSLGLSVNTPIVTVGGNVNFNKTGDVGVSLSNGYSVTLNESTNFSGTIPYMRDNPSTPEDEFKIHGYGFTPYVYRAHYQTPEKKDAAYFVVTYTVDKNK